VGSRLFVTCRCFAPVVTNCETRVGYFLVSPARGVWFSQYTRAHQECMLLRLRVKNKIIYCWAAGRGVRVGYAFASLAQDNTSNFSKVGSVEIVYG
jgi:hypothetical protein